MDELIDKLKQEVIQQLNLEDISRRILIRMLLCLVKALDLIPLMRLN